MTNPIPMVMDDPELVAEIFAGGQKIRNLKTAGPICPHGFLQNEGPQELPESMIKTYVRMWLGTCAICRTTKGVRPFIEEKELPQLAS
ncbi:MAG: hypothetical protein WCT08_04615 [Patescibacteria group bacterium]